MNARLVLYCPTDSGPLVDDNASLYEVHTHAVLVQYGLVKAPDTVPHDNQNIE